MTFCVRIVVPVAACLWLSALPANAQWRQCVTDIEALRDAAEQAREASDGVATTENAMLTAQGVYTRCTQDLEVYRVGPGTSPVQEAVLRDGCNLQLRSYRATERRFGTETDRTNAVFRALAVAVQAVEFSCQYPLAAYAPAEPPPTSGCR